MVHGGMSSYAVVIWATELYWCMFEVVLLWACLEGSLGAWTSWLGECGWCSTTGTKPYTAVLFCTVALCFGGFRIRKVRESAMLVRI